MNFLNKVVIARIYGGIGNQLFIYAMAKKIAKLNNAELMLDINSGFINDKYKRNLMLNYFNINIIEADKFRSYISFFGRLRRIIIKSLNTFLPTKFKFYLFENQKKYLYSFSNIKFLTKLYIDGYWQSYLYFNDIENDLRSDLEFIHMKSIRAIEISKIIATSAIHTYGKKIGLFYNILLSLVNIGTS